LNFRFLFVTLFDMDNIQRKLALIDKQLTAAPTHEQIIGTCPLLFVALGLIAGIIFQHYFNLSLFFWFILLTFFTTAAIVLFIFKNKSYKNKFILAYLALACFACLGSIRLTNYVNPKPGDIRNYVSNEPVMATIRGYILTKPYVSKYPDWKFAQFMPTDPGSSFYMKLTEIETDSGWTNATGKIKVNINEPVMDLKPNDYIQAYCWLDTFKPPTNPGQFNTADFYAKNGIYITASIKSRIGINILQNPRPNTFIPFKNKIKELAETALLGDLPEDNPDNGLLQAFLLGYRGDIDSNTNEAFRKTGLSHYISLSGMHMGIIIGLVWWISKLTGLMKRSRAVICIIAIVIFLIVIPPMAPALRAAIIALMFCLSFFFRRQTNAINTLSLAAIILLLIRPTQLFEAGWQLSFASVLGILLFSDKIKFFFQDKFDYLTRKKHADEITRNKNSLTLLTDRALTLLSVGLAAWLASAGILLYHFYTITPLASLWTVLVFPLVSAILILGFIKILLFFIFPTFSLALGFIVTCLSVWLIYIVKLLAKVNISQIMIGHVPLGTAAFLYCVIAFSIVICRSYPTLKRKLVPAVIIIIIIIPGIYKWQIIHKNDLVMTCLDVGHGQAVFLQIPGGRNILFDAGSMYRSNIGARIVTPFMDYSGIKNIDSILISHNDTDHINGIPEIAEHCNVGAVYANNDFFSQKDTWGTASFLNECLHEMNMEIKHLDPNHVFSNNSNIDILWPLNESSYEKKLTDNDKSLVTLIKFAGIKILLCSDIEQFAQKELLRLYPDLKVDIVVVPHHGSLNTLEPDFLESLKADILICSSDKTPVISGSKQIFYTSRDGAITTSIDKNGKITVRTYNQR
jgi:competence protein ComEC